MLELTTLIIFTWLTLRVRYFHSYVRDYLIFDLNFNNYALVRWVSSLIMTNDPSTNQKTSARQSAAPMTNEEFRVCSNALKIDLRSAKKSRTSTNQLQFEEEIPAPTSIKPHSRSGHRAVATDSDLWIWGGYHPGDGPNQERMFRELWRYNFALQRWTLEETTGAGPVRTLASHSMCRRRNIVFVFGGTGFPFGQHVSNGLFLLDLKRRHWRQCTIQKQQLRPVYGASMILDEDHLYILCGTNSWIYNTDVYDVHLPTLTSTKIGNTFDEIEDPSETGRYRQEAFLNNRKIFVFGGGGVSGISYSLENLPVFDLNTHQWSFIRANPDPVHNFPLSRKFHSILPFHTSEALLFGGAHFDENTGRHAVVNNQLWTFNFDKLEWAVSPSMAMVRPTYFHAATMNERGEIWVHGGIIRVAAANDEDTPSQETRTTTLYTMHTRVSNLSEICWNFFLNSLVDRSCLSDRTDLLAEVNLPPRFRQRIY